MSWEALMREGETFYRLGLFDPALDRLRAATRLDPRRPEGWQSLGVVLDAAGHAEAALRAFEQAIAIAPDSYDAWYNLAWLTGRVDPAAGVDRFRELLQRWPGDFGALHNLACLLRDTGALDESLATFAQAQALRDDEPVLCVNLARLHVRRRDLDAARKAYERALALDPGLSVARDELAAL